jgi:iron complex transport system ATP-binding protein
MMTTLSVENLTCSYNGNNEPVLADVNLTARPGEVLALIGPNGAGKTTLLRAMSRVLRPQQGHVRLDERNIWELPAQQVAQRVACVAQNTRLAWPYTVRQVVSLGRFPHRGWLSPYTADDRRVIEEALNRTGLWALRERPLHTLSGGERQRAIIARALAQAPEVLLLDEPVAHLDLKYQVTILDLVRELAYGGLAVVVSLHDLNYAACYADRLAMLAKGQLLAVGEPAAILTAVNLEAVYDTQVVVSQHPLNHVPLVTPVPGSMREPSA